MSKTAFFFGCQYQISENVDRFQHAQLLAEAFKIMRPGPSPRPLIRIGPNADGGYLVPDDLHGVTACFSPGVSNRKDFEDHLTRAFGIKCHLTDYSSDVEKLCTPLIDGMQTFRKSWLDIGDRENSIRLEEWVSELAPDAGDDLLLQMDIEGAEYRNILACPPAVLARFRIMVLELHGLAGLNNPHLLAQVVLPFLRRIGESFVCVHAHPNNYRTEVRIPELGANMPDVIELSFVRRDRLTAGGGVLSPPLLPHPLDIPRNAAHNKPIVLNDAWLEGDRPLVARFRQLQDEFDYTKFQVSTFEQTLFSAVRKTLRAAASQPDANPADLTELEEVGTGCPYVLTSTWGGAKSGVIPSDGGNYFFHTSFGVDQSITVDLGTTRTLRQVIIGNRRDTCPERARLMFVVLHNGPDREEGKVFHVDAPPEFASRPGVSAHVVLPPTEARYVTVTSPLHTALHFASLQIFAEPT